MDEGAVEADRAPAGVGHFGLVPEARKFRCHAQDVGQILCHRGNITNYVYIIISPETPDTCSMTAIHSARQTTASDNL